MVDSSQLLERGGGLIYPLVNIHTAIGDSSSSVHSTLWLGYGQVGYTQHRGLAMVRSGTLNTVAWGQGAHTGTHARTHTHTHTRCTRACARTHAHTHAHTPLHIVCTCSHIHVQHTIHCYATLSHKASFVSCLSWQTFKCWDVVFVALCITSTAVFTSDSTVQTIGTGGIELAIPKLRATPRTYILCHMTYISVVSLPVRPHNSKILNWSHIHLRVVGKVNFGSCFLRSSSQT